MRNRAIATALAATVLTCACNSSDGPVEAATTCSGTVSVSVGPGTTPVIRWTPACIINRLLVEPTERGIGDRWSFTGNASPPVTYGVSPSGTQQLKSPEPLIVGSEYRVVLENTTSQFFVVQTFRP